MILDSCSWFHIHPLQTSHSPLALNSRIYCSICLHRPRLEAEWKSCQLWNDPNGWSALLIKIVKFTAPYFFSCIHTSNSQYANRSNLIQLTVDGKPYRSTRHRKGALVEYPPRHSEDTEGTSGRSLYRSSKLNTRHDVRRGESRMANHWTVVHSSITLKLQLPWPSRLVDAIVFPQMLSFTVRPKSCSMFSSSYFRGQARRCNESKFRIMLERWTRF